jgi:phosphatidylglycerol:prolipoprotein diacylglycerol transferase
VVAHWQAYKGALLSILSLTPTALSWPEGALVGGVVAVLYVRRHQLPAGLVLDAVAPGLALAMAFERLGAFLSGKGLGEPTTMPWGIFSGDRVRHPVQLYETLALLVVLAILLGQRERRAAGGSLFALFAALYSGSRLFVEAFRAPASLLLGGVRAAQVVALGTVLGAVWYLYWRRFSGLDDAAVEEEEPTLAGEPD